MNFGECPYCNDFVGLLSIPGRCPAFAQVKCESCGKTLWYKFSRIDPMAYTVESFEEEYNINKETMEITLKNPPPKTEYSKETQDWIDKATKIYEKAFEHFFITGEMPNTEDIKL